MLTLPTCQWVREICYSLPSNICLAVTAGEVAALDTAMVTEYISLLYTVSPECVYGLNEVIASGSTSEWARNPN